MACLHGAQGLNRLPMEYVFCRMEWLCQQVEAASGSVDGRHGRRISTESFMMTYVQPHGVTLLPIERDVVLSPK